MSNKNYLNELVGIQDMISKVRTVNEAIQFAENYDGEDMGYEDEPMDTPMNEPMQDAEAEGAADLGKMKPEADMEKDALGDLGEVGQIRELCLQGMIKRCKDVNDPHYTALKKILAMCDKAVEEDNAAEEAQK